MIRWLFRLALLGLFQAPRPLLEHYGVRLVIQHGPEVAEEVVGEDDILEHPLDDTETERQFLFRDLYDQIHPFRCIQSRDALMIG